MPEPPSRAIETRDRGAAFQVVFVLAAWAFLCGLQWTNDGLWFRGDAARHAMNGLFWKDFLASGSLLEPRDYALRYYARYPSISPTTYPPVFYLLEASAFAMLGPSPYVAKGLVLLGALAAALIMVAWLRRWLAPEMGYAAAWILLLPGMVTWSHAIMLNVPAFALVLASLYCTRRWLEEPTFSAVAKAGALGVCAILCYVPSLVLILVGAAWLVVLRRGRLLLDPRTLAVAAACAGALIPWLVLSLRWAPMHVEMTRPSRQLAEASNWLVYLGSLRELFGVGLLILAATGVVLGLSTRRYRREVWLLSLWIGVSYAFYSSMRAKDSRYVLHLAAPLTALAAVPLCLAIRPLAARPGGSRAASVATFAGALIVLAGHAWYAQLRPSPSIEGFPEVAAFLRRVAPDEPLFYDGLREGNFIYYVRAGDPGPGCRVVRGDKLLYVIPMNGSLSPRAFVTSAAETVERLRTRSGCRWLVIEDDEKATPAPAALLLRDAVRGPEFEFVRAFPITRGRINVYRARIPIEPAPDVDLPLPMLGPDASVIVRPLDARRPR